jgi:pilus assembly protein Flp/PilA
MSGDVNFKNFSTTQVQIGSNLLGIAQVGFALHEPDWRFEMAKFVKLLKNDEGATAIEYGLIAALIAVAAIGAMQGIGNKLNTTFNNVSNSLI